MERHRTHRPVHRIKKGIRILKPFLDDPEELGRKIDRAVTHLLVECQFDWRDNPSYTLDWRFREDVDYLHYVYVLSSPIMEKIDE